MSLSRGWCKSVRLAALVLPCLMVFQGVASGQAPAISDPKPAQVAKLTLSLPAPQRNYPQSGAIMRALPQQPQQAGRKFGKATILTIAAAAAIAGIVIANRDGNGGNGTATPATTITPGTVTVGTPR